MGIERVDRTVARLLDALGLGAVAAQARLAGAWEEVVGPLLATKTHPSRLKGGILTVCAVSPAWAQELSLSRAMVLGRIDAVLGPGIVREVRVGVGPVPGEDDEAARGASRPPAEDPGGAPPPPDPEGIENVADSEMRGILASLSRKAASRGKVPGKAQGRP